MCISMIKDETVSVLLMAIIVSELSCYNGNIFLGTKYVEVELEIPLI